MKGTFLQSLNILLLIIFITSIISCGIFLSEDYKLFDDPRTVGKVTFLPQSQFNSDSVSVSLNSDNPDDLIYYTLDGSAPTLEPYTILINGYDGPDVIVDTYGGGILYTGPINITETTLIRARVYRKGSICGRDSYNTYFIDETTTLPIFSLAIEPAHLYDDLSGIYTAGNNSSNPVKTPYGSENYFQDWERPMHIEYFDEAQTLCFEMDAGVQIFGGWSRQFDQKSLAIFARGEYGLGVLPYDFFGITNNTGAPITAFTSIILRNSGDDWYRTMFRDAMLQSLLDNMDVDRQAYKPAVVFINGQYWGIHNIREKINEDYLASHYDYVRPDQVDILESYDSTVVEGDNWDFKELVEFIQGNDMSATDNYAYVQTKIDIDNFIDYMIAEIYFNNTDWLFTNIKYWRPRTAGGKWRWIIYDLDGSFGGKEWVTSDGETYNDLYNDDDFDTLEWVLRQGDGIDNDPNNPDDEDTDTSIIFYYLFTDNADFKNAFGTRFRELLDLGSNFDPAIVNSKITQMEGAIDDEIPDHTGRWEDSCDASGTWADAVDVLIAFSNARNSEVSDMLTAHGIPP